MLGLKLDEPELFLPNDGVLNFIFFNFSKKVFGCASSWLSVLEFSVLIDTCGSFWIVFSLFVCTFTCSKSSEDFSFSFEAFSSSFFNSFCFWLWTSSNHFSKIGIASSRFGVPDEDIFCFPSI